MRARTYFILAVLAFLAAVVYIIWLPSEVDNELLKTVEQLHKRHGADIAKDDYRVIVDYSLPIYSKRLWVIDAKTGDVVIHSHVSHAWKSGFLFATDLSNEVNSEKSCGGAFVTDKAYNGDFGNAMRIKGLDAGINDNAYSRAIVFHESFWPWSRGCFMTLPSTNRKLIDLTGGGALLYVNGR
ncbi:MAG: murein L,D-transpeptidase catalytic domain-containing protein [Candidatus Zixiibacteriota bacterium]